MSSPEIDHHRDRRSSSLNRNSGRSYSKGQYDDNYGNRSYNNRVRNDKALVLASNFPSEVTDHEIKDFLHHEMEKFGDVANVHIRGRDQNRQAYIHFRDDDAARELRRYCLERHCKVIAFSKTLHFDFDLADDRMGDIRHSDRYNNRGIYNNKSNFHNKSDYRTDRYYNSGRNDYINNRDRFNNQSHDRFYNDNHINPKATRTLFVGNLDHSISKDELMRTFDRWGDIDDIDIKRPPNGIPAYAFIKYLELEAASAARIQMFGKEINGRPIKVGYGKTLPSTTLWIGGLGHWCTTEMLNREFDRFGALRKIDYTKGNRHAFIEFESLDASSAAYAEMIGFPLGGPDRKIKIVYAETNRNRVDDRERSFDNRSDNGQYNFSRGNGRYEQNKCETRGNYVRGRGRGNYENQSYRKNDHDRDFDDRCDRRRSRSRSPLTNDRNEYKRRNSLTDTKEGSPNDRTRTGNSSAVRTRNNSNSKDNDKPNNWNSSHDESNANKPTESLIDVSKRFAVVWRGAFALKNSAFPVRMHLIGGNPELANFFLRGVGTAAGVALKVLSVTQRLRLDPPKLDEVSRRISQVGASGHCVLLALPTGEDIDLDSSYQRRPLKSLVTYFKKKEAAGVIISHTEGSSGKQEESGMLHAFPPCDFSQLQLLKVAPKLCAESCNEDHLVVIVVKGTSS